MKFASAQDWDFDVVWDITHKKWAARGVSPDGRNGMIGCSALGDTEAEALGACIKTAQDHSRAVIQRLNAMLEKGHAIASQLDARGRGSR